MNRVSIVLSAILLMGTATARAQTAPTPPTAPTSHQYYAAVETGVTAGHTASALFNVDIGRRFDEAWDVYLEGGRMTDTRTAAMDTAADVIAKFLGTSATADAKQPVNYGAVGVRYKMPTTGRAIPYVGVGIGVAKVTRTTDFAVNGTNVNSTLLSTYGVQLGSDLSGGENKAIVTFGVGAQIQLRGMAFADVSYRFGRVFLTDEGLNTNRVQVGIGVRFR